MAAALRTGGNKKPAMAAGYVKAKAVFGLLAPGAVALAQLLPVLQ